MNKQIGVLWLSFLLLVPTFGNERKAMSGDDFDRLLDYLDKELAPLQALSTDFVQEKHIELFGEVIKGDGRLLFRKPKDIRFEITKPFQSVLIVSGKKAAKYEHTEGNWKRLHLPNRTALTLVMNQIAAWMQGKFRTQSRIFKLGGELQGKKRVIVLTPKPKRFAELISRIEIELVDGKASFASITIREPDGDHTVLLFKNEQRNKELPAKYFDTTLTKPAIVEASK